MSCITKPVFKPLPMANGCLISLPAIFSSKTSYPYLSIPSKPIKLHLSCSFSSSLPSSLSLNKTTHSSSIVAFVAQTSDWDQQGKDTTIVAEEEFSWGNPEVGDTDEEGAVEVVGDAGESGGEEGFVEGEGEESYPELSEDAKIFVGNLHYEVDSEKLAQLFEQAGVVEIAEVIYNRETDQSRGFGFVTMSTVEEAEKAVEMFHRYMKKVKPRRKEKIIDHGDYDNKMGPEISTSPYKTRGKHTEPIPQSSTENRDNVQDSGVFVTEEGECASSVLTREPQQEVLEMNRLEAELESELQKLPWCSTEASGFEGKISDICEDLNGRLLTVNKAAPRGSRPERPPRVFEPTNRIYVGNLPWDVDSSRLEQLFSEHGKVVDARVVSDRETGRSRGFGFVTMSTEAELNDAIASLDGKNLGGRAIRVNVAEERPRRGF